MSTPQPAAPAAMKAPEPPAAAAKPSKAPHTDSARDHFESILFALVLALLFRTFVAEAFVIPTGSMAPTLYGRNKETTCSHCGHSIVIGASDELNADSGLMNVDHRIQKAICLNCRGVNDVTDAPAYNGDRILVNKFPYELGSPERWDVFVFKYPEEPQVNYIKRLVGLPGETIRIRQGNVYLWDGQQEAILRKDDVDKQKVLQIPLYDDRYPARELLKSGWPERWAAVGKGEAADSVAGWSSGPSVWTQDAEARSFHCQGQDSQDLSWIRYRHFVPSLADWHALEGGEKVVPKAQLVTDFCGYNSYAGQGQWVEAHGEEEIDRGEFWVGDLTLSTQVEIKSVGESAQLILELVEGGIAYQCRIDCKSATAVLFKVTPDRDVELASAPCGITGPGSYHVRLANVDDRLVLWVNDRVIPLGPGVSLDQSNAITATLPTDADLTPAGIAARGMDATVSELLIERDVYYRADMTGQRHFHHDLARQVQRPEQWSQVYLTEARDHDTMQLQVDPDGFLAFGDNSPRSKDSRMWDPKMQSVPRRFLVGKAFYIYWPHGIPFMNGGRGYTVLSHYDLAGQKIQDYPKYTAPFYPQFSRMKRIR